MNALHTFSHNPIPYLTWVGVPAWAIAVLSAAFWLRFDAPIWSAW